MRYPQASDDVLRAPNSQFRVIGVEVNAEAGGVYQIGDFPTPAEAQEAAASRAGVGNPVFVYNDRAELVVRLGSWH